jgi:NAD+ synthase (glutamine-hydrolysing)
MRRIQKLGPVSMFEAICGSEYNVSPRKVAEKIKLFFQYYGKNRHKMAVLTPSLHYYP